jgi:hypothetical protein
MRRRQFSAYLRIVFVLVFVALAGTCTRAQQAAAKSADIVIAKPESVGFSSERLERLHSAIQLEID